MEEFGFFDDQMIVVVDEVCGVIVLRFWWMFDDFGYCDVCVLYGGLEVWCVFELLWIDELNGLVLLGFLVGFCDCWIYVVSVDDFVDGLGCLFDVCVFECYCGDVELIDFVVGYIFGVVNVLFFVMFDECGCFFVFEWL